MDIAAFVLLPGLCETLVTVRRCMTGPCLRYAEIRVRRRNFYRFDVPTPEVSDSRLARLSYMA
jgi:hypothetical protein